MARHLRAYPESEPFSQIKSSALLVLASSFLLGTGCPPPETSVDHDSGSAEAEDSGGMDASDTADGGPALIPVNLCAVAPGTELLPGQVLDVGHASEITDLKILGDRLLSVDTNKRWILWDLKSRSLLLTGDGAAAVGLAGKTLAVMAPGGDTELRDSASAGLRARIMTGADTIELSKDGSYLWGISKARMAVWSLDGGLRFARAGDYSKAKVYAAPGELRVALAPGGEGVIETIDSGSGASVLAPFTGGKFHSWFVDGERFLSNLGTTVWVHARTGKSLGIFDLSTIESLTGQGDYFWTYAGRGTNYLLEIYKATGGPSPPVAYDLGSYPKAVPSGEIIGVLPYGKPSVHIVHLDPAKGISRTTTAVPAAYLSSFGADPDGAWWVGTRTGLVYSGRTPEGGARSARPLGCGQIWSMAGAGNGTAAIATAAGIVLLDLQPERKRVMGTIPFPSGQVELSADGAVLAASATGTYPLDPYIPDRSLKLFALPAGIETMTWAYASGGLYLVSFSLAGDGSRICHVTGTSGGGGWSYQRKITDPAGAIEFMDAGRSGPLLLSQDGALAAFPVQSAFESLATRIYRRGMLVTAVEALAVAWLDGSRLLAQTYEFKSGRGGGGLVFSGSRIYAADGKFLSAPPLPELGSVNVEPPGRGSVSLVPPGRVYSPRGNRIYDIATGAVVWASSHRASSGCVAGKFVVSSERDSPRIFIESF